MSSLVLTLRILLALILFAFCIYTLIEAITRTSPWIAIFGSKKMANELTRVTEDLKQGGTLAVTLDTYGYFKNGCKTILEVGGEVWDTWIWNLHIEPNTLIAFRKEIGWGNHNNHYIIYINPGDMYSWQTRKRARHGLRWLRRQVLSTRHSRETRLSMAQRYLDGTRLLSTKVPKKVARTITKLESE